MKIALICLISFAVVLSVTASIDLGAGISATWEAYKTKFSKRYASDSEEFEAQQNFFANLKRIQQLREKHQQATGQSGEQVYGINKFTDIDPATFKKTRMGFNMGEGSLKDIQTESENTLLSRKGGVNTLPTKYNWFTQGACTPVKDQGQCGSCWAFSATEEIESMWIRSGHQEVILAPQQIVSCDTLDYGCGGGWPYNAYTYVEQAGGLVPESDDPYTSGQTGDNGICNITVGDEVITVVNYTYAIPPCSDTCTHQNEQLLLQQLYTIGPLSICLNASPWQFYTGGVMTASECPGAFDDIDHCVQLVGWDKTSSPNYWILRNSWNTDWGIDGFIYLSMGSNTCGVADLATYVSVKAANQ